MVRVIRCGLFGQVMMLAQLDADRVGHDLAAMNLSRMAPMYHGVPSRLGICMNRNPEITSADTLLHDFFELGRGLFLPIHDAPSTQSFA